MVVTTHLYVFPLEGFEKNHICQSSYKDFSSVLTLLRNSISYSLERGNQIPCKYSSQCMYLLDMSENVSPSVGGCMGAPKMCGQQCPAVVYTLSMVADVLICQELG